MAPRQISRRQALTLLGAAGVGTALVGACGSDGDEAATATSSSSSSGTSATTGALAGSGAAGAVTRDAFQSAASCRVTPEQTEGPHYIDVDKIRSDIREDRPGTPLRVAARVLDTDGCTPVKDAVFEIWHCDAAGVYSGFEPRRGRRAVSAVPGPAASAAPRPGPTRPAISAAPR